MRAAMEEEAGAGAEEEEEEEGRRPTRCRWAGGRTGQRRRRVGGRGDGIEWIRWEWG